MSTTFELYILLFLPIVVLAQIVQDKCVYVFYIIEHSIIHFFLSHLLWELQNTQLQHIRLERKTLKSKGQMSIQMHESLHVTC